MDEEGATTAAVIARIAGSQHGVVEIGQLRDAGVSKDSVWKAVKAHRLHRVFRGVYAVGHRGLSNEGRWMAAVLACGEGAVLSHRSAAELWALLRVRAGSVDVDDPQRCGSGAPAWTPDTSLSLTATRGYDASPAHPGTTPARTLLDLRRVAPPGDELRKATRQAEFLGSRPGRDRDRRHTQRPGGGPAASLPPPPHPATRGQRAQSAVSRSTSSGAASDWWWRSTDTRLTAAARLSRTIEPASSSLHGVASACAASPPARSSGSRGRWPEALPRSFALDGGLFVSQTSNPPVAPHKIDTCRRRTRTARTTRSS